MNTAIVESLCVGQPQAFRGDEASAIGKRPATGPVRIGALGLDGDAQADRVHHGGIDMAVHLYPQDHYEGWATFLGGHELLSGPAAFGENLCARGLTEGDVHIGDRFRLGTALLEISQPRKPCWKIEHRFGRSGMLKRIISSHISGWYFRILEEGIAEAGDALQLVEEGATEWTVERAFACLIDPAAPSSPADLGEMAGLDRLSADWRRKCRVKANEAH